MRILSYFTMMLICFLIIQPSLAQGQSITIGTVVQGEITALQPTVVYSFEGREGDVIYFYISPTQIDQQFYGRLFDADANLIIETEAFPLIYNFVLPATQTYSLLIGNTNNQTGAFSLLIDFYQPQSLSLSTNISGTLASSAHLGFYTLDVIAGTLFRYSTIGVNLGVSILDPNNDLAVFTGTYESPEFKLGQFSQTGQYLLIVNTDAPDGVDYNLFLELIDPIPLVVGTPVRGSSPIGDSPVFSFQSLAGKAWELNAILPDFGDRLMFIAQFDDRDYWDIIIATDSGSGAGGNPRITPFIAPADATYYVWLEFNPYNDEWVEPYTYQIQLSSATILSLAPDVELMQTITPETGAQTFIYTTTSDNERIEVHIRRVSDTGSFGLQVLSPQDSVVYVDGRSANAITLDLNLPVAGLYRFIINDISYEPTELQITIRLRQLQNK